MQDLFLLATRYLAYNMRFFKLFHYLSLDVALGALAYQALFWWIRWQVFPPHVNQYLLFSSIWMVYLLDRLIDSTLWRIKDQRHQFIQSNSIFVGLLMLVLVVGNLLCLFLVDKTLLFEGFGLLLAMGLYWLGWVKNWYKSFLSKETFTAVLYVTGIVLPISWPLEGPFFLFGTLFFLIVFHHLKLFLHLAGKPSNLYLNLSEMLMGLMLCALVFYEQVPFIVLISFLITLGVQLFIRYFYPKIRSRPLAEAAYWSPLIFILYELFSK